MIDERCYREFHERLTHLLRTWCGSERQVRRALQIVADGERRYGDYAFAVNREVFMAADFVALARDAKLKSLIYSALAKMQEEDLDRDGG